MRLVTTLLWMSVTAALCGQQPRFTVSADSLGDRFGHCVGGAGDVDGDGHADLVVGAPNDDDAGTDAGSARVLSGKDGAELFTVHGERAGDRFGWSVDGAGDVDGDGFDDLIVGAPGEDTAATQAGSVYVLSGRTGAMLFTFRGSAAGDQFGWAVGAAGDVDADGFADVIAGGPFATVAGATEVGGARVFSGRDGSLLYAVHGDDAGDWFGWSVGGAGDVNTDGFADVIVGAPGADHAGDNAGRASVFSGLDGAVLLVFDGDAIGQALGFSVSAAGDVNADGVDDVVVGAPLDGSNGFHSGRALVFSGTDGAELLAFAGDGAGHWFGASVAGLGDTDADGFDDLAVGAPCDDRPSLLGSVRVFSGRDGAIRYTLLGDAADELTGLSVTATGDVNGDGLADLAFGAPADVGSIRLGRVTVVSPYDAYETRLSNAGDSPEDRAGWAVAGCGDVNADGVADVIVGVPRDDAQGDASGSAYVRSGVDGTLLHEFHGDAAGDEFGGAVSGAGDVNRDGHADLLVGARYDDDGGRDAGSARVLSGKDGTVLYTFFGDRTLHEFGSAVSDAGDVDGDGFDDVIVGAQAADTNGRLSGLARVFSGRDGTVLRTFLGATASARLGWSVASAGDVDRDGAVDVIVASTTSATVFSVADGRVIHAFAGRRAGGVDGLGDIDGDGFPDLVVGDPGDSTSGLQLGAVRVYSGQSGVVLRTYRGPSFLSEFGATVADAGDVDGDGAHDIIAGITGVGTGSGSARLYSPSSASATPIFELVGQFGEALGFAVDGVGDTDGDGFAEVIIGAPLADTGPVAETGRAIVLGRTDRQPGLVALFGAACAASNGSLPTIDHDSRPEIGRPFTITLGTAPGSVPVVLHLDLTRRAIDLGAIGRPECVAVALPFVSFPMTTSATGGAGRTLRLPRFDSLLGLEAFAQWIALEPTQHLALSRGAKLVIGRPRS